MSARYTATGLLLAGVIALFSPHVQSQPTAPKATLDSEEQAIQELRATQQQLLDAVRRELSLLPTPATGSASGAGSSPQEKRRAALVALLEEIENRVNEEGSRPRKRYISQVTREASLAGYYERFKQRVELAGTQNFPESEGRRLYGQVKMLLTVSAHGAIEMIEVLESSSPHLSAHAIKLIRSLAPYETIPGDIASSVDQLVIFVPFWYQRGVQ